MKSKFLFLIIFTLSLNTIYCQTYQVRNRIWIGNSVKVKKSVSLTCNKKVPEGYTVKDEFTFTNGAHTYTCSKVTTTPENGTLIPQDTTISLNMEGLSGWANITVDEKKKSLLHVNYYLNGYHQVKKGTIIMTTTKTINCDKTVTSVSKTETLKDDKIYNLTKAYKSDTTKAWFINSGEVVKVYTKKNQIDYYLVDKYDRTGDYTISLQNRQFISYNNLSYDFGPIIIPFKYRFGYNSSTIKIDPEVTSNLNIGIFGGPSFGRYRMRLEGTELKELAKIKASLGLFASFSSITLDSLQTTSAIEPLGKTETKTTGVFSYGVGVNAVIYNIQLGVFIGSDNAIGDYSEKWNYNKRIWLGFGLGYNLSGFWKKD